MKESPQSPDLEADSSECPACGNPKYLGACPVCSKTTKRAEYREAASHGQLSQLREKLPRARPEIPKDVDGKPLYGPGSDQWEEMKRRLTGNKKTA